MSAVSFAASRPLMPVKALALPELTTSARALPLARGRRGTNRPARSGHFERVSTPADRRALVERDVEHVGAALVADAGLGGREAHARDRRAGRGSFGRERRDGMGRSSRSASCHSGTQRSPSPPFVITGLSPRSRRVRRYALLTMADSPAMTARRGVLVPGSSQTSPGMTVSYFFNSPAGASVSSRRGLGRLAACRSARSSPSDAAP